MKIVVLDGYTENPGDLSWDELGKLGDLTVYDRTSLTDEREIISRIGDAEVVFTNKTPISKAVIDACPNMKFISLLATGYNVVDYVYAGEKGIPVTNVPTYGTASVSQFSIALLLEICHHIGHHDASVHAGNWGEEHRLVLLGLPPYRAGGQDHRHHRLRPHRTGRGAHRQGPGDAGAGL